MLRRLRIAASVFFAVVAMAVVMLWVRSASHRDEVNFRFWPNLVIEIISVTGEIEVAIGDPITDLPDRFNTSTLNPIRGLPNKHYRAFSWANVVAGPTHSASFPHYAVILAAAVFAVVSWLTWMPRRFSLRTMLIATTLVAAALGLIVWASR